MRKSGYILISFAVLLTFLFIAINPHEVPLEEEHALEEGHNPIIVIDDDDIFTTPTDYFPTCPVTIYIKVKSAFAPYDVTLERQVDDTWVVDTTLGEDLSADVWYVFTPTCTQTGWWSVKAGSVEIPFSIETFFVIPELPFGSIMAMLASLGAVTVLATRKRLRLKL